MPLAVRELARASGKELLLVMEGETTEVDKHLVERLLDPLLHLVRNAIIHGIETPSERIVAGKRSQGTLTLRGVPQGENILITVSDDGRGIDFEKILQKAISLGLLKPERGMPGSSPLTCSEVLELICQPGFTTRGEADLGAGRGVGLDIVLKMVQSIGGKLDLGSAPGQGTTFLLYLPVSLTIVSALIVRCGEERCAIPQRMVDQVIEIDPAQISRVEGGELYPFRQDSLTLLRLSELFHLPCSRPPSRFLYGLVSSEADRRKALVVDQLVGLREIVVHTIVDPLIARPGIMGASELGDGSLILILDLPSLFKFLITRKKV
jgi:two-component system chemotaxis sensor kinase CheA